MATSKPRAVRAGDKPAAPRGALNAAKTGTRRDVLVAMRDRVAKTIDDQKTAPRDLAALTRRLIEITDQIEQIDRRIKEETGADVAEDAAFEAV